MSASPNYIAHFVSQEGTICPGLLSHDNSGKYYGNDLPLLEDLEAFMRDRNIPLEWGRVSQDVYPQLAFADPAATTLPRELSPPGGGSIASSDTGRSFAASQDDDEHPSGRANVATVSSGRTITCGEQQGMELSDLSSESPAEQRILTPNSSHQDSASVNGGSFDDPGNDCYLRRPDGSPATATSHIANNVDLIWPTSTSTIRATIHQSTVTHPPEQGAFFALPRNPAPPRFPWLRGWAPSTSGIFPKMNYHDDELQYDMFGDPPSRHFASTDDRYPSAHQFSSYVDAEAGSSAPLSETLYYTQTGSSSNHSDAFPETTEYDPDSHPSYMDYQYAVHNSAHIHHQQAQFQGQHISPHQQLQLYPTTPGYNHTSFQTEEVQQRGSERFSRTQQQATAQLPVTDWVPQQLPNGAHPRAPFESDIRALLRAQTPFSQAYANIKESKAPSGSQQSSQSSAVSNVPPQKLKALVKAPPGYSRSRAIHKSRTKSSTGGRAKGMNLSEAQKMSTAQMRDKGACWRCGVQHDTCKGGSPCERCVAKAIREPDMLSECGCVRDKLFDMVHDFLPTSMTTMHDRHTIEYTVRTEVSSWSGNFFPVSLTNGYGPDLKWNLCVFEPATPELLDQLQYFMNPVTGVMVPQHVYSPPLGLIQLLDEDRERLEAYLEQAMTEDWIANLGWDCFEYEADSDDSAFQCNLVQYMVSLWQGTLDTKLKDLLGNVLRMMIINYIMGYTFTIKEDELADVLSQMGLADTLARPHTSPRLANRQLKFFFADFRMKLYDKILRQLQNTFKDGNPTKTWLTSFCAMLGFAIGFEEVQKTLQIQADAKAEKHEMPRDQAYAQARGFCDGIDQRFKLMTAIFLHKYSKKGSASGTFGPGTPILEDEAERSFLINLRELIEEKEEYLVVRKDVECLPENQSRFTSRLVSRFILAVLGAAGR